MFYEHCRRGASYGGFNAFEPHRPVQAQPFEEIASFLNREFAIELQGPGAPAGFAVTAKQHAESLVQKTRSQVGQCGGIGCAQS